MAAFSATLPTVSGSEDTWGTTLNANWTALETFLGSLDSAELAVLDGITATTAELNILDGVTATAAELNYVDGVTSNIQTQLDAKAPKVETVYALSGTAPALNPANGTIQTWTLTGNSSPTDSFASGESILLMIDDGSAYEITAWPTMTWVNNAGSEPTLATSGYTVVVLWKVSTTLYGALVGDGS